MKNKIYIGIPSVVLLGAFLVSATFFTEKNTIAQIDQDCQKEYQTRQFQCIDQVKSCDAACSGAQDCVTACSDQRNACDEAANAWYLKCLGLGQPDQELPVVDVTPTPPESPSTPPPVSVEQPAVSQPVTQPPPTQPPKQPTAAQPDTQPVLPENQGAKDKKDDTDIDSSTYVVTNLAQIVNFKTPVTQTAMDIKSIKECEGSVLPSQNPCLAEQINNLLKIDKASYSVDGPTPNYNTKNIAEFYQVIEMDAGEIVLFGNEILDPLARAEAEGMLDRSATQLALPGIEDERIDSTGDGVTVEIRPELSELYDGTDVANLVVLDSGGISESISIGEAIDWNTFMPGTEVSPGTAIVTDESGTVRLGGAEKKVIEIMPSGMVVVAGWTAADTLSATDEFFSSLQDDSLGSNVMDLKYGTVKTDTGTGSGVTVKTPLTVTKSKHTAFSVSYDPEKFYAITVIYKGEVEVTNLVSGKTAVLATTEEGKPRAVVVPLAQGEKLDSAVAELTKESGWRASFLIFALLTILLAALAAGAGYLLAYRHKAKIAAWISKFKRQPPNKT